MAYKLSRYRPDNVEEASQKNIASLRFLKNIIEKNTFPVICRLEKDESGTVFLKVRPEAGKYMEIESNIMLELARIIRQRKLPVGIQIDFLSSPRHIKLVIED